MKRTILAVFAMLAALGSFIGVSSALAQTYTPAPQGHYFFGHASTAQEGCLRGSADVIRAWGEANYWNSLAAIQFEQARSAYMDNKLKAVNTYFQMRETNKAYVRAEIKRPTTEQAKQMAKAALPPRASASQLDPATGQINWPAALQGDHFASHRAHLEALFAERLQNGGGKGSPNHAAIEATVREMKEMLADDVHKWPTGAFIAANSLLKSLAYEASFPANNGLVAAK